MEKKPTRLDFMDYLERQINLISAQQNGLLRRELEELLDSVETIEAQTTKPPVDPESAMVAALRKQQNGG